MNQSQFTLFRDIGVHLFRYDSREALRFAMNRLALPEPTAPTPLDPQLIPKLEAAIERTKKNSSPSFFGYILFLGDTKKVLLME